MTATEELRRLLDERGVEHYDGTERTLWGYEQTGENTGIYRFAASEISGGFLQFDMFRITPEQAVAATLGDERLAFLEEKVKLQGEYIVKLSEENRVLLAQNCEAATRHAGQMDYMQLKLEAATADADKCHMRLAYEEDDADGCIWPDHYECDKCGAKVGGIMPPKFCPNCGRKVVK